MASPRFVHDAVVVTTPGVTPCHPTAGPAQKPTSHALPPARSPTAPAGFQGMPIGQIVQQEDLVSEDNACPGDLRTPRGDPGQAYPFKLPTQLVARLACGKRGKGLSPTALCARVLIAR